MSTRPKKSFGQHFLHDRRYIERIVTAIAPRADDVGGRDRPGRGRADAAAADAAGSLTAIELDTDLIPGLQARAGAGGAPATSFKRMC